MRRMLTVLSVVAMGMGCDPQTNTAPPTAPETTSDTPSEPRRVYGTSATGDVRSEFSARLAGGDPVSLDEVL